MRLDEEDTAVLIIVAFVVYPFALAGIASWISQHVVNPRYCRVLAKTFAAIGVVPAVLLAWGDRHSVSLVVGFVLILCFAATGGLIGVLLDWLGEKRLDAPRKTVEDSGEHSGPDGARASQ